MPRLAYIVVLSLFFSFLSFAQTSKEVLFTINGKPFYTDEFVRVYQKNLDLVKDESQKDLDHYLQLFVGYKLKIQKAYELGLHENPKYQNELRSYRTQLAKNYITDSKVTQDLLEEGYQRSLKEIRASHILLNLDENSTPQDTLRVYNSCIELRNRILKGEDFAALAQKYSQDPSAKENSGDLGFFSAFRMVYPFENAAYSTPLGSVSMPVRTRFGYHLVKVTDIRDNRGEVTVAHIMLLNTQEGGEDEVQKNKKLIQEISTKIKQGEAFEDLAKQFSQDKSTASKGGLLNRFGSGQLSSEMFETVAFSLEKPQQVSEPFQTQFGWHIVKLISKHPLKSFDESKSELETKISRDERSRKIAASLQEKLRAKYPVKTQAPLLAKIKKTIPDTYYDGSWELPAVKTEFAGPLFSYANQSVSAQEFLEYLYIQQKNPTKTKPIASLVDFHYQAFIDQKLNQYYNDNLEQEFPEFAAVMDEYRDGLLLFDLLEKEIWEKSKTDTLGLKSFHEQNRMKYVWKKRYDMVLLSSTQADVAKKAHKMLKQGKTPDAIKLAFNTENQVKIMATAGEYEEGSDVLPKQIPNKTGLQEVFQEGNYYYVLMVNAIKPAGPKLFEECKGRVINDYQNHLESHWVSSLQKEFNVSIDTAVFQKVKSQIKP
ncbi:peptidylprolyl isomerase [Flavobacterium sp.]|uniref:peptidylprolyl isomerase n=1 Tax=Flavobacterium sp. TaxID=239 RepID=UPI002FDB74FF